MNIEIQRFERGASTIGIDMADQQVGAEQYECAYLVGIAVENGAIDTGVLDKARVARRAERVFGETEPLVGLSVGQEFPRRNRAHRWGGKIDIAARCIELAGQPVETVDRAVHLHRVRVHFCAGPALIARWQFGREHACSPPHVFGGDPGDVGGDFRCVTGGEVTQSLRRRPAGNSHAVREGDVELPENRWFSGRSAWYGHVNFRCICDPDDMIVGTTGRVDVGAGQQRAGIVTDEKRPVGPVAQEGGVIEGFVEQHVGHRQCQGAVTAGADTEPAIGFLGQRMFAGVDHDQLRAALHGPADAHRGCRLGCLWIYAP